MTSQIIDSYQQDIICHDCWGKHVEVGVTMLEGGRCIEQ